MIQMNNQEKDISIVVESANIHKATKNHVFVLSQWNKEEHKLEVKGVKLVDAMVAPMMILSVEGKILCSNLNLGIMINKHIKIKSLIPKMVAVENAWKHSQELENHVYVKSPSQSERQNLLLKAARYVAVMVATLEIIHTLDLRDLIVILEIDLT